MVDRGAVKEDMCCRSDAESGPEKARAVIEDESITISRFDDRGDSRWTDPAHRMDDIPRLEVSRTARRGERRIKEDLPKHRQRGRRANQGWVASAIEPTDPDHGGPPSVPSGGDRVTLAAAGPGLRRDERHRRRDI